MSKEATRQAKPKARSLRSWSLLRLLSVISEEGSRAALVELLGARYVHANKNGQGLLLPEYIAHLHAQFMREGRAVPASIWDDAYDLTLDKFTALPQEEAHTGVDCRKYYRAFMKREAWKALGAPHAVWDEESFVALALQQFVRRHFYFSYLEARRKENVLVSRYTWHCGELGTLNLRMPCHVSGQKRREWLWENVPDADPRRPGERERVQSIIDQAFGAPRIASLDELESEGIQDVGQATHPNMAAIDRPPFARTLAKEKAASADLQRPSIRRLGPEKIEQLVIAILDVLLEPGKSFESLAEEFELSKSTMSRFAGEDWSKTGSSGADVPDLWNNAAHLLSTCPAFREMAGEAGVLRAAGETRDAGQPLRLRENNDA